MLVKLLLLLLIILIALFLIIFSESIHVSVLLNYLDNVIDGQITIRYYFISYVKNFSNNDDMLVISTRFFSKQFILNDVEDESELSHENNEDNEEDGSELSHENNEDKEDDEISEDISKRSNYKNIPVLIKRYYPEVMALKHDILDILLSVKKIFFIGENYLNINLGLNDNNLTIKICTFLWSLAAIFYPIGLNMLVKPIINESKLEIQSHVLCDISLLSILKILFKIISNTKLVKLLISIYKELN